MIRSLHKIPGLAAALLIAVLAISGALLSVFPAAEKLATPAQGEPTLSVGDLADRVLVAFPGVEQIRRSASGQITAFYFDAGKPGSTVVDPATGRGVASAEPSAFRRWLTNLHRSLFLGDAGRIASAAGAASLLILSLSGLALTLRRVGGWRRYFSRLRGPLSGRMHVEIARIAVAGLLLSSVTALWMTAGTFDLVPDGANVPPFPTAVSGGTGIAPSKIPFLRETPVATLRELTFPFAGDATDAFTLKTSTGEGYLDQGTGALLGWADLGPLARVNETIYMLHTGQGAWALGLILGLMALGAPVMGVTGVILWLRGRKARPRIRHNVGAGHADTILLVGSENGSTWGFATTLQKALTGAGHKVHVAPMSRFDPARYGRAERVILLAATYGDGAAPTSAKGFVSKLASLTHAPRSPLIILGFGDRQFPAYCAYAQTLAGAAQEKGWELAMPVGEVDRQSPQDFARWGLALGQVLGHPLELHHQPQTPRSQDLHLISRRDYGTEMQAPTAILRFALPHRGLIARLRGRVFPRYAAGDLLGILPKGARVPRYYSLASSRRDGFIEICVSKHPGGLCSGQLMDLAPGQVVQAFIRRNRDFRPAQGRKPVILIGAGTGIGPLMGFARSNHATRPMHLYFGARHPQSDLLYDTELTDWQRDGRLASVTTAFSRTRSREYVQDALRRDAARVLRLIEDGAQVLVCGGRGMASGVTAALAEILSPAGLTPALLKAQGRYVEDVY